MIPVLKKAIVVAAVGALLAGCADGAGSGEPDERLSVVVAFFPLEEAVERIGGDRVRVVNVTPPGAEPHDLELSSRSLDAVLDADLVVYLGRGFQPALEEAVGRRTGEVMDVLDRLPLRTGEPDAHDHDHGHADETGEEIIDPHVWLDPELWADVVERIEDVLARLDPAEDYRARGATYREELSALAESYEEGLASCDRDLIVTTHASFGYLAERYGLRQEALSGPAPEAEPDPRRMAELADLVVAEGVTTVFTEPLVSPRVAETLAREADVTTAVLDPIESAMGDTYLGVMRTNLGALREALGCR